MTTPAERLLNAVKHIANPMVTASRAKMDRKEARNRASNGCWYRAHGGFTQEQRRGKA